MNHFLGQNDVYGQVSKIKCKNRIDRRKNFQKTCLYEVKCSQQEEKSTLKREQIAGLEMDLAKKFNIFFLPLFNIISSFNSRIPTQNLTNKSLP